MLRALLSLTGKFNLFKYVGLGIFSGICSFLFITLLTGVLDLIMAGRYTSVSQEYLIVFFVTVLFFVWSRKVLSTIIIKYTQILLWKLRKEILATVLQAKYEQFFNQKSKILTTITNNVYAITEASMQVINFTTESVLAIACLIFMFLISPALCFITLGFAIIGIIIYQISSKKVEHYFERSLNLEVKFQGRINDLLNGFKEIHMEPAKGDHIYNNQINPIANEAINSNLNAYTRFINSQVIGHVLFYVLMTLIVLIFSVKLSIERSQVVNFVFTLLYFLASIQSIMAILPSISKAVVASKKLVEFQNDIQNAGFTKQTTERRIQAGQFDQLTVMNLTYHYAKETREFGIKGVDFTLNKGEITFIYGGNGSGKTTFINTLLGLFKPHEGTIRLNEEIIDETNYAYYKTCFAVVFSDFFLFDDLYFTPEKKAWNDYIQLFELEGKVDLEGSTLTTTNLSTGQRKRLALVIALLENKPILVLDEWAADQDPYFRKKFYTEILPLLSQKGITVLAITHDDNYYHCADKLFKMSEGILTEENIVKSANLMQ